MHTCVSGRKERWVPLPRPFTWQPLVFSLGTPLMSPHGALTPGSVCADSPPDSQWCQWGPDKGGSECGVKRLLQWEASADTPFCLQPQSSSEGGSANHVWPKSRIPTGWCFPRAEATHDGVTGVGGLSPSLVSVRPKKPVHSLCL